MKLTEASCRELRREDAGVRPARCYRGSDRAHPDTRPGRALGDGVSGAPEPRTPAGADDIEAAAVDLETSDGGAAPRRRRRSARGAIAGSRRRRIAARWFLRNKKTLILVFQKLSSFIKCHQRIDQIIRRASVYLSR